MSERAKALTPVVVVLLGLAMATAAFSISNVTYRAGEYESRPTGEVLIDGQSVLSIRTSAAGLTPLKRAAVVAGRLQEAPESAFTENQLVVRRAGTGRAIYTGDRALITVTPQEARTHLASPEVLAQVWQANLIEAVTGERPPAPSPGNENGNSTNSGVDWRGTDQKWVPIFSLELEGARIGAAQVAGPTGQVDKVKGVAQLRLDFRDVARIYVYIPVSSISLTNIDRVQGVSVWAIGDIKILEF